MTIITGIIFLAVFSLLVVIHELGHFLTARLFKVKVEEFGLGLPPKAWGKKLGKQKTLWSLNWIPLGGFVRMKGQDDFSLANSNDPDSFSSKNKLQRAIILIAGVTMNYLLAIFLLTIGFVIGMDPFPGSDLANAQLEVNPSHVIISEITPDSPAFRAGFQPQDMILKINNNPISDSEQLLPFLQNQTTLKYQIQRADQTLTLQVTPDPATHLTGMAVGTFFEITPVQLSLPAAISTSFHEINRLAVLTVQAFGDLVMKITSTLTVPSNVSGPIGILALVDAASQHGFMAILQLTAILSVSLAVINILPIPALDGGRLLFIFFELFLFGKKIPHKVENTIHLIGFAAVIGLILFITWADLMKLFS